MDWSKVGSALAENGLTLLGGALGGPAGAAVGRMVGTALGLSDPDDAAAVQRQIEALPAETTATLRTLEIERSSELALATLAAQTESIRAVNATAQVEAKSEDAYVRRCRPTLLYLSGAIVAGQAALIGLVALTTPEALPATGEAIAAMATPQALLAGASGYYFHARSRDKQVAASGADRPSILDAIAARIAPSR